LRLVFHVSQIDGSSCTALTGATVDLWHCDALGVYSGRDGSKFQYRREKVPARLSADGRKWELSSSLQSIPVGIQAELSTFTSRFASVLRPSRVMSLRRSFTLTIPSRIDPRAASLPLRAAHPKE
jgi:hypothetical protein